MGVFLFIDNIMLYIKNLIRWRNIARFYYNQAGTTTFTPFRIFLKGEYYVRQGRADSFLDTGNQELNEWYTQQAVDKGVEFAYWVYESDAWPTFSASDRAYSRDPGTSHADVNTAKLLEILEHRHGLIPNHPTEIYIALDFEEDWLAALSEGRDPRLGLTALSPLHDQDFLGANNRRATEAYVNMTEACQAYFGPNAKISNYGIPRIYNFVGNLNAPIWVTNPIGDPPETSVEWRNATPESREIRIQRSVEQNTDVMAPFDWYMGTHYDAVPSAASLFENGGTVTQRGNTTPSGFPITDFNFESRQDDQRNSSSYDATYRIIGQNSSKPVFALISEMYPPGIHFRDDISGGPLDGPKNFQYIPIPEIIDRLQYLKSQNPKLNGVMLWNYGSFSHDSIAFSNVTDTGPTGPTSYTHWFRTSIVRELYGGTGLGSPEDPVSNGTYSGWTAQALKNDVAIRYNDRILELIDEVQKVFGPPPTGTIKPPAIAPLWTPAELGATLVAWYDASDPSYFTIETGVAEWRDRSGNGLHLVQGVTANQPLRNLNVNGLTAVQFDGVNDVLRSNPLNYPWPILPQPFTVVAVFVPPPFSDLVNATRYWSGFQRTRVTTNDSWVFGYNQVPPAAQANYAGYGGNLFGGVGIYLSDGTPIPNISPNVILSALTFNGNPGSQNRVYGTVWTPATSSVDNTLYGLCLGAESVSSGSVFLHSKVAFCEFMILQGDIDTLTMQKIEGYLSNKWGVQPSLVSTHPYRNVDPIKPRITIPTTQDFGDFSLTFMGNFSGQYLWKVTPVNGFVVETEDRFPIETDDNGDGYVITNSITPPGLTLSLESQFVKLRGTDLTKRFYHYMFVANQTGVTLPANLIFDGWNYLSKATFMGKPDPGYGTIRRNTRAYPFEYDPVDPKTSSPWHNVIYERFIEEYAAGFRALAIHFPWSTAFSQDSGMNSWLLQPLDMLYGTPGFTFLYPRAGLCGYTNGYNSLTEPEWCPARVKGFTGAIKQLLEGTMAPIGRTAISEPCDVIIYTPSYDGYPSYRAQKHLWWDKIPGSSADKDNALNARIDQYINELILPTKATTATGGILSVALDVGSYGATPKSIHLWRTMPDYRSDACELATWNLKNKLRDIGVYCYTEARGVTQINRASVGSLQGQLGVSAANGVKAIVGDENYFWFSDPDLSTTGSFSQTFFRDSSHIRNINIPAVHRMSGSYLTHGQRLPWRIITETNFAGFTMEQFTANWSVPNNAKYTQSMVYSPYYSASYLYSGADIYLDWLHRTDATGPANSREIWGQKRALKQFSTLALDPYLGFAGWNLINLGRTGLTNPSVGASLSHDYTWWNTIDVPTVNTMPLFYGFGFTTSAASKNVSGYPSISYTGGFWTERTKNWWNTEGNVRGRTLGTLINVFKDLAMRANLTGAPNPPYWVGPGPEPSSYPVWGTVYDTYWKNGIDYSIRGETPEIWVSSWLPTDPDANVSGFGLIRHTPGLEGGRTSGSLPENMGNVNRFEYIKPSVYFMKCAGDGGFEEDYAPVGNQGATGMINANCFAPYTSNQGRLRAIKDRLLALPKGRRSLNPRRYDQGNMYDSSYRAGATYWDNFSNGVTGNIFANSIGATLANDFKLILQSLKNLGGDVDYITFDLEEVGPKAQYSAGAADALFDARVNAIVADPNYNQPYFTGQTFSQILSEFAGFTLNHILDGVFHPQLNPSYIYWDRAITSNFAAWTNEFLAKPAQLIFPEVNVANYGGYLSGATNDNFFYDLNLHPARFKSLVGNAQAPELYGGIGATLVYGVLLSDPTKIFRTNVPGFTTDGGFPNTAWNNFLVIIHNARSIKREAPNIPLRPWIASINFKDTNIATPPWTDNDVNRGLYYEMIRHLCLTGTEMFNYWNPNDWTDSLNPNSSPNWFTTNLTRLNNTIKDVNERLIGWRNTALNTQRFSFYTDYVISGAPINNNSYLWRLTAKPGITLFDESENIVVMDSDGGAWLTTNSTNIPSFTTES